MTAKGVFISNPKPNTLAMRRCREKPEIQERQRKACRLAYANDEKRRAYSRAYSKKLSSDPDFWSHGQISKLKARAKKKGIPFDLTEADIQLPKVCPVLGIPIVLGGGNKAIEKPGTPSVDRIINSKGYVKGNVRVISFRANRIKLDADPWELRAIADYMERERAK